MQIQLSPELEAQIRQDLERGSFRSVDEYVEQALEMLHAQETWLVHNRGSIAQKIQAAWDAAERGELTDEAEVRQFMKRRQAEWAKQSKSA